MFLPLLNLKKNFQIGYALRGIKEVISVSTNDIFDDKIIVQYKYMRTIYSETVVSDI